MYKNIIPCFSLGALGRPKFLLIESADNNNTKKHDCQDWKKSNNNNNDYAYDHFNDEKLEPHNFPCARSQKYEGCPEEAPKLVDGCTTGSCYMPGGSSLPSDLKCKYRGVCVVSHKDKEPSCGEEAMLKEVTFQCGDSGGDKMWEITCGGEHLRGVILNMRSGHC